MPTAAFSASGSLQTFFIVTPAVIPSDWALVIQNNGTPGASSNVYIDSVSVVEAVYHGGVAAAVVPGSSRFCVGDRFTVAISNDDAGVFQKFFRQNYKVQLPSSATPTNADSMAT
jgi:hypothetical protein